MVSMELSCLAFLSHYFNRSIKDCAPAMNGAAAAPLPLPLPPGTEGIRFARPADTSKGTETPNKSPPQLRPKDGLVRELYKK